MTMMWVQKHPRATADMLGLLPTLVSDTDPRGAREQFNTNYQGGWDPFPGFTRTPQGLKYPGDPPMPLLAEAKLRDELIEFYDCAWVAVVQPDGSFEVCRMD